MMQFSTATYSHVTEVEDQPRKSTKVVSLEGSLLAEDQTPLHQLTEPELRLTSAEEILAQDLTEPEVVTVFRLFVIIIIRDENEKISKR